MRTIFLLFGGAILVLAGLDWLWADPQNREVLSVFGKRLGYGVGLLLATGMVAFLLYWILVRIPGAVEDDPEG